MLPYFDLICVRNCDRGATPPNHDTNSHPLNGFVSLSSRAIVEGRKRWEEKCEICRRIRPRRGENGKKKTRTQSRRRRNGVWSNSASTTAPPPLLEQHTDVKLHDRWKMVDCWFVIRARLKIRNFTKHLWLIPSFSSAEPTRKIVP